MNRNILKSIFASALGLGLSGLTEAADLGRAQMLTRQAINEGELAMSGRRGTMSIAENYLRQVPIFMNDLPRTPAVNQIDRYLDDAIRSIHSNLSLYDQARTVVNDGNEIVRLIDVLIRNGMDDGDHYHDPGYRGGIRDTFGLIDDVNRAVSYRDYRSARRIIWDIENILRNYPMDYYLTQANYRLQEIESIVTDPYTDDWTKQVRARNSIDGFKRAVMNSDAYRRERGGYYPPREPGRPWPPPRHDPRPRPPFDPDRSHDPGRPEDPRPLPPFDPGRPQNGGDGHVGLE